MKVSFLAIHIFQALQLALDRRGIIRRSHAAGWQPPLELIGIEDPVPLEMESTDPPALGLPSPGGRKKTEDEKQKPGARSQKPEGGIAIFRIVWANTRRFHLLSAFQLNAES